MVQFLDPETAKILQFLNPEIVEMDKKKNLDPEIVEMVQSLDPETAEILQFLDPEIVKLTKKILDPEILEMVRFLNPEIVEKGRQILYRCDNNVISLVTCNFFLVTRFRTMSMVFRSSFKPFSFLF